MILRSLMTWEFMAAMRLKSGRWCRVIPSWGANCTPHCPISGAEVIWAVRHEMARTIEDVLARRMRALFLNARAALEMAPISGGVDGAASWDGLPILGKGKCEKFAIQRRTMCSQSKSRCSRAVETNGET